MYDWGHVRHCECTDGPNSEEGLFGIRRGGMCRTECNHQLCGVYGSSALFANSLYDPIFKTCSHANIMSTERSQFDKLILKVGHHSSINVSVLELLDHIAASKQFILIIWTIVQ